MTNARILDLLNAGKYEELKKIISDEIYKTSLKGTGEKQRYAAMKRFFKYQSTVKEYATRPAVGIELDGNFYNSFLIGSCFALTTENIGDIQPYDNKSDDYPVRVIKSILSASGENDTIDINTIISQVKANGYKYNKQNYSEPIFVFRYKESYYNIALLDMVYSIINDGKYAEVIYSGSKSPLIIKTSIGTAVVLPFNLKSLGKYEKIEDADLYYIPQT